jgi:molybdopterin-containing oxidoreductase family membrane subunit
MNENDRNNMISHLIKPIIKTTGTYYVALIFLGIGVIWGVIAWLYQYVVGLGVTGLNNNVTWGIYLTNFVFFIGISHAGTLISAILRVSGAEWRRPITRAAEAITVFALVLGVSQIIIDMGRPDRLVNTIIFGRLGSPLLWDIVCVSIYLLSSIFYLLLPLVPDMGILRDHKDVTGWRKHLYRILAVSWDGNHEQKERLEKVIGIMAIAIIPIAVSVHTVGSWIFGMTPRPMWHSTILGPYFVVGAIFSGIAMLLLAMATLRKIYHLENYLKPVHFNFLGMLLLTMTSLWFYFTLCEYITTGYVGLSEEMEVYNSKIYGQFSILIWTMLVLMTLAFFILMFLRKKWTIGATCTASFFIIIGMWIERYTIVVPTLQKFSHGHIDHIYTPSWVEWSITLASFCGFVLLYVVFCKLFPIISIWEIEESEEAIDVKVDAMRSYLPTPGQGTAEG